MILHTPHILPARWPLFRAASLLIFMQVREKSSIFHSRWAKLQFSSGSSGTGYPAVTCRESGSYLESGLVETTYSLAKMIPAGLTSTFSRKHKLGTLMKSYRPFSRCEKTAFRGEMISQESVMVKVQITYATVDRMRRLTGIPLLSEPICWAREN